jgi:hypothetical protein
MTQNENKNDVEDLLSPVGYLTIEKFNADGKLVDVRKVKNTVVATGKTFIAGSMIKTTTNTPTAMTHMGIGTGVVAVNAGTDTTLGTANGARVTFTEVSSTGNQVTYKATFAGAYSGAITEAGIFNALTSGTMLCRTVFGVVTKTTSDTITITWTITVS